MHHSKRQNCCFLLVMLRLELRKASVLAVGMLTLGSPGRSRDRDKTLGNANLLVWSDSSCFLKELICKVLGLLVPLLELNQFGIILGESEEGRVDLQENFRIFSDYWLLPVAGPLFLQLLGASLTQGKASSIPTVFSWGDSISPDGFLPSILLLLVIIFAVSIVVTVILAVVVVGEGSSIIKL
ncbi:hypothetical protein Tco_0559905 [Tanacetum coccineum]